MSCKRIPYLPILKASTTINIPANKPISNINYKSVLGDLISNFNPSNGKLFIPFPGVYEFSVSVTFEKEGNNYVKIIKPQQHSGLYGSILITFTNLSILCQDSTVWLEIYSTNDNIATIEFIVVRLSYIDRMLFCLPY